MTTLVSFVSDFGDENILWPIIIVIITVLIWQQRWFALVAWSMCVITTFSIILTLKLSLEACGRGHAIYSASGHTAGATMVYGGAIVLFLSPRLAGIVGALLISLVMGMTRVLVGAHNVEEVVCGGATGLIGVGLLIAALKSEVHRINKTRPETLTVWKNLLWTAVLAIIILLHGERSSAEQHIERISHRLGVLYAHCSNVSIGSRKHKI